MSDLISRQAAIDAPERHIKDCNPEHFAGHQKFIEYMDNAEIGSFGSWQFANGFNMGLTAAEVAIKQLPSAQPEQRWIPCSERLPEDGQKVLIQNCKGYMTTITYSAMGLRGHIAAWMPLPEPYKEGE